MLRNVYVAATLVVVLTLVQGSWVNFQKEGHTEKLKLAEEKALLARIEYLKKQSAWVDSTLATMTDDEKIGQLFMVAAYSNKDETHYKEIDELVSKHAIGGLIFFQGGPVRQALLTNRYQQKARVPLLISIDGEWGLAMRLDSTQSFPRAMTLGAIQDDRHIYEMGKEIARQCKRLGIHVNLAPVADVNSNPANPVIGTRSFGENKENVARKAILYMKGMQHNGVIANAKHFPGHGDTDTDSHLTLPVIRHDMNRLHDIELYPFKKLIQDTVMSMMVAHIHIPAIDSTHNRATTLSKAAVTKLLIDSLHFRGIIFTDALNMQGVAKFHKPGEADVQALLAGNDALLYPESVPAGIAGIKKAVADGKITMAEIEKRVRKILQGKYFVGLDHYKPVETKNLYKDLNTAEGKFLRAKLYEQAVTIVKNENHLIPFVNLENVKFASVAIGADKGNDFQRILSKYAKFDNHVVGDKNSSAAFDRVFEKVQKQDVVIVSLHDMQVNKAMAGFGISEASKAFIKKLEAKTRVVVVAFGTPYGLKYFEDSKYLVCAYDDDVMMRKAVPQVLFGAVANNAKLPVSASAKIREGMGFPVPSLKRLQYSDIPESVGFDPHILDRIDTIANFAIEKGATPGCQVLVAKEGKVIFSRNYGYFTYDKAQPVEDNSIYDIASLTKVAATVQAVMYLHEKGKIDLNEKISTYLPELKGTNKEDLTLINILTHQAGLYTGMPLFSKTLSGGKHRPDYLSTACSDSFCIQVADNLYATSVIQEKMWDWIIKHDLRKSRRPDGSYGYLYTDVGFYMLKNMVERLTGYSLDVFVEKEFYGPLGVGMTYLPLTRFPREYVVPTEVDKTFRHTTVQGVVHDPDAALYGGVAGHAGVFACANDLAVLMQMNLQNGYYGGRRYLKEATVPTFAHARQRGSSRRGLGWDKPIRGFGGPSSGYCSQYTYGHTGFTGTCVWVDPAYDLVYIFLSNRTYPKATNRKLQDFAIRNRIHNTIYEAMGVRSGIVRMEKTQVTESEQ